MPYSLPPSLSLEGLIDYSSSVIASLKADPTLAQLAEPWTERRKALRQAREVHFEARERLVEAEAVLRMRELRWDDLVMTLSGTSFLLSGQDVEAAPYALLFGTIKAHEALGLGPAKVGPYGRRLLKAARDIRHAELTPLVRDLAQASDGLEASLRLRDDAEDEVNSYEVRRGRWRRELEALGAMTAVGILVGHPGRQDYVRLVLGPDAQSRELPVRDELEVFEDESTGTEPMPSVASVAAAALASAPASSPLPARPAPAPAAAARAEAPPAPRAEAATTPRPEAARTERAERPEPVAPATRPNGASGTAATPPPARPVVRPAAARPPAAPPPRVRPEPALPIRPREPARPEGPAARPRERRDTSKP